jgi:murein L,D-transpeptidase YcbB/YkuD
MKFKKLNTFFATLLTVSVVGITAPSQSIAQGTSVQAAAQALRGADAEIAAYYKATKYKPIFAGNNNNARRKALLLALRNSDDHGLPSAKYQVKELTEQLRKARRLTGMGQAEIAAARIFVRYANDLHTGILTPSAVDSEIAMKKRRVSAQTLLKGASKGNLKNYLAGLAPQHSDYKLLVKEKQRLSNARGSNVPDVPVKTIKPGQSSNNVVAMRRKLQALGYGNLGNSKSYDAKLVAVVKKFQTDRRLGADGIAGPATIRSMNLGPKAQLARVIVNMERQRWLNFEREKRHIFVNLPDFSVAVMDNGKQSFYSRTVIGKRVKDQRSPEFIDSMTHMVINPTWHVPASIAGKEYLPIIRKDPGFLRRKNMAMLTASGKSVNPANIDLAAYNEDNFPYFIKQRPDPGNALGLVKFMFPNKYNIYLHDTPSKSLFNREVRAFSHGCIRVHKPFDFAYKLLERQSSNPKGLFQGYLKTGQEKYVNLKSPVQVIITYQTVVFDAKGNASFRGDIYGRDAKIAKALRKAGVAI